MSWASIAKKAPQKKQETSLKVQYNVISKTINKKQDGIPRHKEIMAHPADDYIMTNGETKKTKENKLPPSDWNEGWIDFEKNEQLKAHKESLPLSMQRVIEWAQQIIGYLNIIDLDFDEIDKDLKYQYKKYNGDKLKLNKIYFPYNPEGPGDINYYYSYEKSSDYDTTNFMYFGEGIKTMIHFIFQMYRDNDYSTKQAMILLQLLIKNNIIYVDDVLELGSFGFSIWEGIMFKLCGSHDLSESIDDLVDLVMIGLNQKEVEQQPAIIRVYNGKQGVYDLDDVEKRVYCQKITDSDSILPLTHSQINNDMQFIEKLLFRGVAPFHFVDLCNDDKSKQYIHDLFHQHKIYEKTLEEEPDHKRCLPPQTLTQMALLAPLVLVSHINRARCTMNEILSKCICHNSYIESDSLSKEIADVISYYLFVDYDVFYSKEIQNNVNVKAIGFLNHLKHFQVDDQFMNEFNEKYNNKEVINYLVDNYLYSLSTLITKIRYPNIDVLCALIETYNRNNNDGNKFPLRSYGIYYILEKIMDRHSVICDNYESFVDLLKFFKCSYQKEFDINFKLQNVRRRLDDKNNTIIPYFIHKNWTNSTTNISLFIIESILNEFKVEYNMDDPCLLYVCFKYMNIEVFKYLITNYDYSLKKICVTMTNMMNDIMIVNAGTNDYSHQWTKWNKDSGSEFLRDQVKQCCIELKCKNDEEIESLNKTITDTWNIYINNF